MALTASVFRVSLAVTVVLLATAAAASARPTTPAFVAGVDTNATARRSATTTGDSDQYICYLCNGRNTLMIKWCPLDVDDCHIACLSSPPSVSSSSPRALASSSRPQDDDGDRNSDDCYVMKLYPDGSWVIVDVVSCRKYGGCLLVCGCEDAPGAGAVADAGGTGDTSPAAAPGTPPFGLADFQRCGDQLRTPGAAAPGV